MDCCLKWDKNSKWEANGNFISPNNSDLDASIEPFSCACNQNKQLLKLQNEPDDDDEEWFTPFYLKNKKSDNVEGFTSHIKSEIVENNWEHDEPRLVMDNIIHSGFRLPKNYLPNRGGLVIWKRQEMPNVIYGCNNVLVELMIKDELVPMKCPNVRNDYLYTSINIDLSPKELQEIQSINGTFTFDTILKVLTVRYNSLEGCIILLKLALNLVCKNITIQQIHEEKRLNKSLLEIGNNQCVINAYKELVALLGYINNNLNHEGYWRGSHNKMCGPPNPYVGYHHGNLYSVYK